jgi:hypothetical protein
MLSKDTKFRLVHALADQAAADEMEKRLISVTPANAAASQAVLDTLDSSEKAKKNLEDRLFSGLAGNGSQGREMSKKILGMLEVLKAHADGNDVAAVAAVGTLNLVADIILTSVAAGAARNTNTFTLQVLAAAANPTDTILADFTGTAAAIVCTITPNDGTNNGATPVDLTTAELRELINSGVVVGKTVTVTDAGALRNDQTATGGDATALADAGEGDGIAATFAAGANAFDNDTAPAKVAMGSEAMSDAAYECLKHAVTDIAAANEIKAAYNAMVAAVQAITP